jgi:hypothetical protein
MSEQIDSRRIGGGELHGGIYLVVSILLELGYAFLDYGWQTA